MAAAGSVQPSRTTPHHHTRAHTLPPKHTPVVRLHIPAARHTACTHPAHPNLHPNPSPHPHTRPETRTPDQEAGEPHQQPAVDRDPARGLDATAAAPEGPRHSRVHDVHQEHLQKDRAPGREGRGGRRGKRGRARRTWTNRCVHDATTSSACGRTAVQGGRAGGRRGRGAAHWQVWTPGWMAARQPTTRHMLPAGHWCCRVPSRAGGHARRRLVPRTLYRRTPHPAPCGLPPRPGAAGCRRPSESPARAAAHWLRCGSTAPVGRCVFGVWGEGGKREMAGHRGGNGQCGGWGWGRGGGGGGPASRARCTRSGAHAPACKRGRVVAVGGAAAQKCTEAHCHTMCAAAAAWSHRIRQQQQHSGKTGSWQCPGLGERASRQGDEQE